MNVIGRAAGQYGEGPEPRPGDRSYDDRGQAAIEFTGMVPIILATVILLWEAALVGYTFSLAGNAADEAVRAATVAVPGTRVAECTDAAENNLPGPWNLQDVDCQAEGDLVEVDLTLDLPLFFPGVNIPINVPAHASAVRES
ncbi:TadE family protein [Streptomyces sp. NPDC050804]|uniref:TadE/TadG family type IV pilus assembly protein n=1 Tax=unclassified Streptomyces TaxID=2593676 RepID=UPI00342E9B04|nr:pilus assembly protein [Streptomyces sp. NBC_00872]